MLYGRKYRGVIDAIHAANAWEPWLAWSIIAGSGEGVRSEDGLDGRDLSGLSFLVHHAAVLHRESWQ